MVKIKIWALPINDGAGAAFIRFFSSREKMEEYEAKLQNSPYYEGWGDGVGDSAVIEVHENGTITGPDLDQDCEE